MTLATPWFTHVYRATVKNHKGHLMMRFEVAGDSVAHAEAIVDSFVGNLHPTLARQGYTVRCKRVRRNNTDVTILVG